MPAGHAENIGIRRIGILQTDDSFGADGLTGAQKGLVAAKITPVLQEKFDRAKPDFAPIVAALSAA